ncbi:tRNA-U16,U17-dihydrouridine synthase [Rubellimicrobium thermophilum DSM 16684]|uniref:tRNA-dihydrouridine(20/20a) synthase n=1 Tax=Rubellimicrobium thermophilum DSM 16684 TaxID=1123069 RepID=S9QSG6_9RHOB|nr:tRNA dihydrouridine(20/20a) synthase DusA [Rubellimicrobium thermophilum]EPX82552.1 tRNA-U16,U17-dihydrouridine synthase [Rubellimicrobium thermophilum DSM 16684]
MADSDTLASAARLSVAPMMDWTDRHCRAFHRALSRHALLYTEMVTAPAILHGDRDRLLGPPPDARTALQLGGSDPAELAQAARIGAAFGYREVNLNCGCPSDRVQSGCFGAVLMRQPALVADCVRAMQDAADAEITVKCRLGVDDQDPEEALPRFLEAIARAGVRRVIIHARKAWLQGLSPRENREVPPLDYPLARRMKDRFSALHLSLNGGLQDLDAVRAALAQGFDGAMVGRAAYHRPWDILGAADHLWAEAPPHAAPEEAARAMLPYLEAHCAAGGRLHQVTRHMLGLFAGRPGARIWRRLLSEQAHRPAAGPELVEAALAAMEAERAAA